MQFSDPYIMLFQLYWKHRYGGEGYIDRCIDTLWKLVDTGSERTEYLSNLGLLMQVRCWTPPDKILH